MRTKPKVSIILPVYNVEKYIAESVQSVLSQTYDNLEIIVVDDGSSDKSIEIAKDILENGSRNYRIIRQNNMGLGEARNRGMREANGEWIYFLDSDDMIAENTIEYMVRAIEKDTDLVFSKFNRIKNVNDAIKKCDKYSEEVFDGKELQFRFLKRENIVLAPGTLFNKYFLQKNNLFFEKIPWSEDQQFIWRVLYHVNKVSFVDADLYQYLERSGSIMTATKCDAMIKSYSSIKRLADYYDSDSQFGEYIVARWVMGTANAASRILCMKDWKKLIYSLEFKMNAKKLLKFPDFKVRLISGVALISTKVYYYFIKILK